MGYGRRETRKPFKVVIHRGELAQIRQWVNKYPRLETGGDLFGLWSKGNTAVVQLVLGPGRNSGHNSMSFFQDAEYLHKVGSHLTEQYGLCHIGEWHSHHSLGLAKPSDGDQSTVWSNMPKYGFKRFIVFIANIDNGKTSRMQKRGERADVPVGLGCFLFETKNDVTGERYKMMQGSFEVIPDQAPYRKLKPLVRAIKRDAEPTDEASEVEVKVDPVRSGATGHEGNNVLLYHKGESTGQPSNQQNPDTSTVAAPQPLTIAVDELKQTGLRPLWERIDPNIGTFLKQLSRELDGQLIKEINTVTIQFLVKVPGSIDFACRLVYDGKDFLGLYVGALSTHCVGITFEAIFQQKVEPRSQFVKAKVKQHVAESVFATVPQLAGRAPQMSVLQPSTNTTAVTDSTFLSNRPAEMSSHSNPPPQATTNRSNPNRAYRENASSSSDTPMDTDQGQPPLMGHGYSSSLLDGQHRRLPATQHPQGQAALRAGYPPQQQTGHHTLSHTTDKTTVYPSYNPGQPGQYRQAHHHHSKD